MNLCIHWPSCANRAPIMVYLLKMNSALSNQQPSHNPLTQGGRADTQGRRAVPTGAVPRARTQGGVGTQVVVPRASTHSSEVGAQSGGAGTQGGRAAPMEVPNTPPCFARAQRGRTNVCMFSLPVLGPSMSFGLWPMWYYRGGLSPSKRPPRSLRSPPVSMPSGHGRSSTSST